MYFPLVITDDFIITDDFL